MTEPTVPDREATRRRRDIALAGHRGDAETAGAGLADPAPVVRATALEALARLDALTADQLATGLGDPSPAVRARAAELAGRRVAEAAAAVTLVGGVLALLDDTDDTVVEAAAFGLGEMGTVLAGRPDVTAALARTAGEHRDPLCRETAVAALGAIGDEAGLDAVLAAVGDKPAVRRRAVIALAAFDGPRVEAALETALSDRDWQVRQAAEDLTDRRGG